MTVIDGIPVACRVVCLELGTGSQTSRVTFSWVCPQLESDVTDTNASPHSLVILARQLARGKRRAPLAWVSIAAALWQRQPHRRLTSPPPHLTTLTSPPGGSFDVVLCYIQWRMHVRCASIFTQTMGYQSQGCEISHRRS